MTRQSDRRWIMALFSALVLFSLASGSAAVAHEKPKNHAVDQRQQQQVPLGVQESAAMPQGPNAAHGQMGEMIGDKDDRAQMTTFERLLDWLGRLHPTIVHFPIAFFPAALFTAVIGRRRPAFGTPVQFLVVAGGLIAPIAAIFGWLDALGSEPGLLLTVHRWLGTAIGVGGLGLAGWAWRRPDQYRSAGTIVALAVITAAIVVQGWYGGALVHGIEHLNW